jgi:hypothetical protein
MSQVIEKQKSAYDILVEASEAAEASVKACRPAPIIVGEAIGLSNEIDETKPTYYIEGGVCGFASVVIKPARGSIVAELKKRKIGSAHYGGGYSFSSWQLAPSIRQDQSYERAVAAARGAVEVLKKYGVNAYVDSRID